MTLEELIKMLAGLMMLWGLILFMGLFCYTIIIAAQSIINFF